MESNFTDEQLAELILQTIPLIGRTLDASLRQLHQHLSPVHFGLLKMLTQFPALPQNDLAEMLRIKPSTFSATVDALVKRGWLIRNQSEQDRRVIFIEITPTGREVLEELDKQAIGKLVKTLGNIDEAERESIATGLTTLRKAFFKEMTGNQGGNMAEFSFFPPPEGVAFPPPFDFPFPK